ncbi:glycine betaine ABC transporter substrate-binding protein, partial [Serratia marcescens]
VLQNTPGLEEALNTLSKQFNNQVITELNARVDIDYQTPQQVADAFLKQRGLI